jgi:glycosyltransferase involved in cell wall biosynthesis
MRILFVSHTKLRRELGASKIVVDLSEEMARLGWSCELVSLADIAPPGVPYQDDGYPLALRHYLREHAESFDVLDYDHGCLPFQRNELSPRTLLVARAVLLGLHQTGGFKIPAYNTLKSRVRSIVLGRRDRLERARVFQRERDTIEQADLVNVANQQDAAFLISGGVAADKVVVLPYGLNHHQRTIFGAIKADLPARPVVGFVGTFDARKGANDFPRIVSSIASRVPGVSFRLLGTYRSSEAVLSGFPRRLREQVTVVPSYSADSLPDLLAPCSLGVFPSYLESFGFGVLEMLSAGMPVIAYDVPGPPAMLPAEYLVAPGDTEAMSRKVVALLEDPKSLIAARSWAKNRSRDFSWEEIAKRTSEIYRERWERLQAAGG